MMAKLKNLEALSPFSGSSWRGLAIAVLGACSLTACATVKVEAPDKPIEINLNVKIEQEVLIKLDQEIEDLIENNPDIF